MNFSYRVLSKEGHQERGFIDASSKNEAVRNLMMDGKTVFELQEAIGQKSQGSPFAQFKKLFESGKHDVAGMFGDLAMLTDAGLTISQALQSMRESPSNSVQKSIVEKIASELATGRTASQAFATVDGVPTFALAMIASGENARSFPRVFANIAANMQNSAKTKTTILNSLAYPCFLVVMMAAALAVVTFLLVPSIEPVFVNNGKSPPEIIEAFAGLRLFLTSVGPSALFGGSLLILAFLFRPSRKMLSKRFAQIAIRLPIIGPMICNNGLSRYLSSLAMLVEAGSSMAQALSIAAESAAIPVVAKRLSKVCDDVSAGKSLPQSLLDTGLFDSRTLSMIAAGNDAGKLPQVAAKAAELIDSTSRERLNRLVSVLTPLLTIVMGLVIGGLVVSVMTALLAINELAIQ